MRFAYRKEHFYEKCLKIHGRAQWLDIAELFRAFLEGRAAIFRLNHALFAKVQKCPIIGPDPEARTRKSSKMSEYWA